MRRIAGCSWAAAAVLLLSAATTWAGGAKVTSASGPVWVKKGGQGKWAKAPVPFEFGAYDKVGTTGSTATVTFTDGSKVRVCPNSAFQVFGVSASAVSVFIPHGIIEFFVSKNAQRKFSARTPVTVASVRGTTFRAEVKPKGPSKISVFKGLVRLSTQKGRSIDLSGGQWASVDETGIIGKPSLLPLDTVVPVDPDKEIAGTKPVAATVAEEKKPAADKKKEVEQKEVEEKAEEPPPDEDDFAEPPPPPETVEEDITIVSPSTPQ